MCNKMKGEDEKQLPMFLPTQHEHPSITPVLSFGMVGLVIYLVVTNEVKKNFGYHASLAAGFVLFLGGLAMFTNRYMRYLHLGECQRIFCHFSDLKPEEKEIFMRDLDKTVNKEGLSNLWGSEIQSKKKELRILLTGVTGYVGRAVLYKILREISKCSREGSAKVDHKVYVMIRAKARKNLSAAQRVAKVKEDKMFADFEDLWDEVVVPAESGDLQEKNCGMSEESLTLLAEAGINVIVHCAADVNFNRPLKDSAGINISPSLQLMGLAKKWDSCKRFVHVSTAFVNPESGTPEDPMREALYSLRNYDAEELYESMLGDQTLAFKAKEELKFQNNYVFTKCVGEHMMVKQGFSDLKIVRPAIVGPAWLEPEEAWNGDKPSTISAFMLLWGTRVVRFGHLSRGPMAVIPVDVVANGIIHAMIRNDGEVPQSDSGNYTIRNLIWAHDSPIKFTNYRDMCKDCVSVATLKNLFTGVETAISLFLVDTVQSFPFMFRIIHNTFNIGPLKLLEAVVFVLKKLGFKKLEELPVAKLLKFSDMLTLYQPFMGRTFYFEGSVHVPPTMDVLRYINMTAKATHNFWESLFPGTIEDLNVMELLPRGRYDFWWIFIQARNTVFDCLYSYLLVRVLRVLYGSFSVRLPTLGPTVRRLLVLNGETVSRDDHMIILAPTYRSELDVAVARHIGFVLPVLSIDVPLVLGSEELQDSNLSYDLSQVKKNQDAFATCAAFFQDKSSENGLPEMPNLKNVRALQESIKEIGCKEYTVVPISIDYDVIPEFKHDFKRPKSFTDLFSLYWSLCVMGKSDGKLGAARISFGNPLSLTPTSDLTAFAMQLRREHLSSSVVTEHINLMHAEEHLNIKRSTLQSALEQMDVEVVGAPRSGGAVGKVRMERKVVSEGEKWISHFQWLVHFAPYLYETHPRWAAWITSHDIGVQKISKTSEIESVLSSLRSVLEEAESLATAAEATYFQKTGRFGSVEEIVEEMESMSNDKGCKIANSIANVAADIVVGNRSARNPNEGDEKKHD